MPWPPRPHDGQGPSATRRRGSTLGGAGLPRPGLGLKTAINDLANLAFISALANQKTHDRSPAMYFSELGDDELKAHLVPLDTAVWDASAYREFLVTRRRLLAEAMTALLDRFRP